MKRSRATGLVTVLASGLATASLAVAVPGTASAAAADAPAAARAVHRQVVHTSVSLTVAPRARIVGEPRALVVTVAPQRARYVRVQQVRAGRWSTVAAGRTDHDGRLRLALRAPASLTTSYRAVVAPAQLGHTTFTAARSGAHRVTRQLQHARLTVPTSTKAGTAATVGVRVSPVRVGRPVVLQVDDAGTWRAVGDLVRESATGTASFSVPTSTVGTLRLRAVVRARNGAPQAASAVRRLGVTDGTPPGFPTGLTGTAGNGQVSLTWDASTASDLDHYRVFKATTPADRVVVDVHPGKDTHAVVTGLTNGTEYSFTVTAVDTSGNQSTMSASFEATPSGCPPPPPPAAGRTGAAARVC